jgi:hypothetical protein
MFATLSKARTLVLQTIAHKVQTTFFPRGTGYPYLLDPGGQARIGQSHAWMRHVWFAT